MCMYVGVECDFVDWFKKIVVYGGVICGPESGSPAIESGFEQLRPDHRDRT